MMRKVLAGAVVAGLTLGLVATPASATTVTNGPLTISVSDTTVYKSGTCAYYPYTVTLNTDSPDALYGVDVTATSPAAYGGDDFLIGYTDAQGDAKQTGSVYMCPDLDGTGKFTYTADAEWVVSDYDTATATASATTTYKTPATVTAKASTTKPKKGRSVKVTGKVTYKDADHWKNRTAKKQTVTLQYKPAGSSTWTTVDTAKTTKTGRYTLRTKASKDGYYRVTYNTGTSTGTSKAVYVDVR